MTSVNRPTKKPHTFPSLNARSHHPTHNTQSSSTKKSNPNTMRVFLTNAFGICSKFAEFRHALCKSNADIAIVTETKLTNDKMSMAETVITGYHPPLRLDRSAQGGGVAVWVKDDLAYEHLSRIDCNNHELIWLAINLHGRKKLVVGALYRPGSAPGHDTSLLEHLDTCLDLARSHGSNILLAGDFNVHNEAWLGSSKTTPAGEYLEELCASHGLHQHVQVATRGNNPLDLLISDLGDQMRVQTTSPIGNSDHCVLLASISTRPQRESRTSRRVWRYNQADWGRLRKFYRDVDWDMLTLDDIDPDVACCAVTNKILEGMRQFIPQKQLVTRPTDPSWWTPECTTAVRAKQNPWIRLRKCPSQAHEDMYKALSAESATCLREARNCETYLVRRHLQQGSMKNKEW